MSDFFLYTIPLENHVANYVRIRTHGKLVIELDNPICSLPYILAQTPMISLAFGGMTKTPVNLEIELQVQIDQRHSTRVKKLYNYVECAMLSAYWGQMLRWEWIEYAQSAEIIEHAMNDFRDKYDISDRVLSNDSLWKIIYRAKPHLVFDDLQNALRIA